MLYRIFVYKTSNILQFTSIKYILEGKILNFTFFIHPARTAGTVIDLKDLRIDLM